MARRRPAAVSMIRLRSGPLRRACPEDAADVGAALLAIHGAGLDAADGLVGRDVAVDLGHLSDAEEGDPEEVHHGEPRDDHQRVRRLPDAKRAAEAQQPNDACVWCLHVLLQHVVVACLEPK